MDDEIAYWLGFLYTDGCIQGNSIQFKLKDYEPVHDFKEFLQYEGPIQTVNCKRGDKIYTSYQIIFTDDTLTEKLIELGCIPRKTYCLTFPDSNQLDKEYYRSFIRGVFDGDGSVFKSGNKIMIDITGTEDFLTGIRDILVENDVLSTRRSYIYKSHAKNTIIKRISIAKRESVEKFYDYIYSRNPLYYLQRKKEKFESLLNTNGV